jgi:hypothetical protein
MQLPPEDMIAIVQIAVFDSERPVFIDDLADGTHGQPIDLELGLSNGTMFQLYVTEEGWFQVFYWGERTWQLCSAGLLEVNGEDVVRTIPWANPHPEGEFPVFTIELTRELLNDKF